MPEFPCVCSVFSSPGNVCKASAQCPCFLGIKIFQLRMGKVHGMKCAGMRSPGKKKRGGDCLLVCQPAHQMHACHRRRLLPSFSSCPKRVLGKVVQPCKGVCAFSCPFFLQGKESFGKEACHSICPAPPSFHFGRDISRSSRKGKA